MDAFKKFDWKRTRQVILTIDPERFENGKEAYEHVTTGKLIHGLIRNVERGKRVKLEAEFKKINDGRSSFRGDCLEIRLDKNKDLHFERTASGWCDLSTGEALGRNTWVTLYEPIKITNWKWFLEWHKAGFPHWHLFVETEAQGRAGMIGGDRLRHYWGPGNWVRETYIKDQTHWKRMTGYFEGHGYFDIKKDHSNLKLKEHQMTLPDWAQDEYGAHKKIRRSCAKVLEKREVPAHEYLTRIIKTTEVLNPDTGELLRYHVKPDKPQRTYKAIFADCGARSRVKIYGPKSYIEGIFNIPYRELKEKFPGGEFQEHKGWAFALTYQNLLELFDHVEQITAFSISKENSDLKRLVAQWHDYRVSQGYWQYRRVYA